MEESPIQKQVLAKGTFSFNLSIPVSNPTPSSGLCRYYVCVMTIWISCIPALLHLRIRSEGEKNHTRAPHIKQSQPRAAGNRTGDQQLPSEMAEKLFIFFQGSLIRERCNFSYIYQLKITSFDTKEQKYHVIINF